MEPTDEQVKEVYAHFGLAYYMAEVLHRGLCDLFVLEQLPDRGATRARVEELYSVAFSSTVGFLARRLESRYPEELKPLLAEAVERRNFLAHYFWYERIHLMVSSEGCEQLVEGLTRARLLFESIDEPTDKLVAPHDSRLQISQELSDRAFGDVMAGVPVEPLLERRDLRKQEIVTKAYRVPLKAGGHHIIFETKDMSLWQLCEVGLGWTTYESPEADWLEETKIQSFLPATINPRPQISAAWQYDLKFGYQGRTYSPSPQQWQDRVGC